MLAAGSHSEKPLTNFSIVLFFNKLWKSQGPTNNNSHSANPHTDQYHQLSSATNPLFI